MKKIKNVFKILVIFMVIQFLMVGFSNGVKAENLNPAKNLTTIKVLAGNNKNSGNKNNGSKNNGNKNNGSKNNGSKNNGNKNNGNKNNGSGTKTQTDPGTGSGTSSSSGTVTQTSDKGFFDSVFERGKKWEEMGESGSSSIVDDKAKGIFDATDEIYNTVRVIGAGIFVVAIAATGIALNMRNNGKDIAGLKVTIAFTVVLAVLFLFAKPIMDWISGFFNVIENTMTPEPGVRLISIVSKIK